MISNKSKRQVHYQIPTKIYHSSLTVVLLCLTSKKAPVSTAPTDKLGRPKIPKTAPQTAFESAEKIQFKCIRFVSNPRGDLPRKPFSFHLFSQTSMHFISLRNISQISFFSNLSFSSPFELEWKALFYPPLSFTIYGRQRSMTAGGPDPRNSWDPTPIYATRKVPPLGELLLKMTRF